MKRAYVSALGVMGRRHVLGLVRRGYSVDCFDPGDASHAALESQLDQLGLDRQLARRADAPAGNYSVAIFSEHADLRLANVRSFLSCATAERFLLEKPLSSNPGEVESYPEIFRSANVDPNRVSGNFTRRAWSPILRLKGICDQSKQIHMTVHGGAYGIGGNGIHHIDLFLFLTGDCQTAVQSAAAFETEIRSGRGDRFVDFGGTFVLKNDRGLMSSLCVPSSSVAPVVMITGEHFSAIINERTLEWELAVRDAQSTLPPYRCGAEYEVQEKGTLDYIPMDEVSGLWADEEIALPELETVLSAHRLLHGCLQTAGIEPPFRYT